MSKVVLITNIPSPYRVDFFYYMQTHINEHEFFVIYTNENEDNRQWNVNKDKIQNSYILKSKIIKVKNETDTRYIHIPGNIGRQLNCIMPDVVIAWEYNFAAMQSLLWCKIKNRKFIHLTDGTLFSERNISFTQKIARKIITKMANACIVSSTKAKEKLLAWKVPSEKIFISLLTEDISRYQNVPRTPVPGQILYVGSMVKRKGLDLLINALPFVNEKCSLHIVGNGTSEERNYLQKLAEEKNVASCITWCGFKEGEDLIQEYSKASIFILPTREDCFGLVLLEALCAGVPIISSKYADGAYDVIEEGKNGLLVNPYDATEFGKTVHAVLTGKVILNGENDIIVSKFRFCNVSKGYMKAINYVINGEIK